VDRVWRSQAGVVLLAVGGHIHRREKNRLQSFFEHALIVVFPGKDRGRRGKKGGWTVVFILSRLVHASSLVVGPHSAEWGRGLLLGAQKRSCNAQFIFGKGRGEKCKKQEERERCPFMGVVQPGIGKRDVVLDGGKPEEIDTDLGKISGDRTCTRR